MAMPRPKITLLSFTMTTIGPANVVFTTTSSTPGTMPIALSLLLRPRPALMLFSLTFWPNFTVVNGIASSMSSFIVSWPNLGLNPLWLFPRYYIHC